MKVGELRDELRKRGLSTVGLKAALEARLAVAIAAQSTHEETVTTQQSPQDAPSGVRRRRARSRTPKRNRTRAPSAPEEASGVRESARTPNGTRGRRRRRSRSPTAARVRLLPPGTPDARLPGANRHAPGASTRTDTDILWRRMSVAGCDAAVAGAIRLTRAAAAGVGGIAGGVAAAVAVTPLVCALLALFVALSSFLLPMVIDLDAGDTHATNVIGERHGSLRLLPSLSLLGLALAKLLHTALTVLACAWLPHLRATDLDSRVRHWVMRVVVRAAAVGTLVLTLATLPRSMRAVHQGNARSTAPTMYVELPSWLRVDYTKYELARVAVVCAVLDAALPNAVAELLHRTPNSAAGTGRVGVGANVIRAFVAGWVSEWGEAKPRAGTAQARELESRSRSRGTAALGSSHLVSFRVAAASLLTVLVALQLSATMLGPQGVVAPEAVLRWLRLPPGLSIFLEHLHATVQSSFISNGQGVGAVWSKTLRMTALTSCVPLPTSPLLLIPPVLLVTALLQDGFRAIMTLAMAFAASLRCVLFAVWCFLGAMGGASTTMNDSSRLEDANDVPDRDGNEAAQTEADYKRLRHFVNVAAARSTIAVRSVCASAPVLLICAFWVMVATFVFAPSTSQHLITTNGTSANATSSVVGSSALAIETALATIGCGGHTALPRHVAALAKALAVSEAAFIASAAGSEIDAPRAAAAAAIAEANRTGGASHMLQRIASAGVSRAALQAASPRIFGCGRATLTIEPPSEPGPTEQTRRLRTGLFGAQTAEEQTYDAIVRFSNAELRPGDPTPARPWLQPRRMLQIKVLNVRGERAKSPTLGVADDDYVDASEHVSGRAPPASPVPPVDFELVSGDPGAMEASLRAAVKAVEKVTVPASVGSRHSHRSIGSIGTTAAVLAKIIRAASQDYVTPPQNMTAPSLGGIDQDLTRLSYTSPTTIAFAANAEGERPYHAELQARPCTSSTGSRRRRVRSHGAARHGAFVAALAAVDAEANLEDRLLHVLSEVDGDTTYGKDPPETVATDGGAVDVVQTIAGEAAPRWPLGGRRRRGRGAEARAPVGHWMRDQDDAKAYPAQGSGACFEIRGRAARSATAVDDSLDDGWVRLATLRLHAAQMRPQKRWQQQQHVCAEMGFDVWRNALSAHRPVLPTAGPLHADDGDICRPLLRMFAVATRDRRELLAHAKRRLFRANGACTRATLRAAERKQRLRENNMGSVCRGGGAALGSCAELPELSESSEATLKVMRDVPPKSFGDGWGDFHSTAEAALAARDGNQRNTLNAEWMIPPSAQVCRARLGGWAPRSQLLRSTWHVKSIDGVLGEPYETETERQARIAATASSNGVAKTDDTDGWRPGIEATYVHSSQRVLEYDCLDMGAKTGTFAHARDGSVHPLVAALACAEPRRADSVRLDLPHLPAWGSVSERMGAERKSDSWQWHRRWSEAWSVAGTSTGTAVLSNLGNDVVKARQNEDDDAQGNEHNDVTAHNSNGDDGSIGPNPLKIGANAASALRRRFIRAIGGAGLGVDVMTSNREQDTESASLQFARRHLAVHTTYHQQEEIASSIDAFAALQVSRNDPSGTHAPFPCRCSSFDCTDKAIATTQLLSLPPPVQQAFAVSLGSNTSCGEQFQSWPWQVGISAGTPLLVRWLCSAGSVRSVHSSKIDPLLRTRPYDPIVSSRARLEHARSATDIAREKLALKQALDNEVHADKLRWTGEAAQCPLNWYPGRAWGSARVRSSTTSLPWLHPHHPFSSLPGAEWNASLSRNRNAASVVVDVSFDDGEDEWGVPLAPQTVHVLPKALELAAFPAEPHNAQPSDSSSPASFPTNDWQVLWQRLSRADKAAFRRTHNADLHFARQFVAGHNPFMITRVDSDEGLAGGRASEPAWSPFDDAETSNDWSRHIDIASDSDAGQEKVSESGDTGSDDGSTAANAAERFAGKWPRPARRGLPAPVLHALEALDHEGHHMHYTNSERERRDGSLGGGESNSDKSDCSKLDGGLGGGTTLQRLKAAAGGDDWRTLRREGRLFFADYSLLNAGSGMVSSSDCGIDDVDVGAGADGVDEDLDGVGATLLLGVWRVGGANRSHTVEFAHDAHDTGRIKVHDLQPVVDEDANQPAEGQHDNTVEGRATHESIKVGTGGEHAGSGPGSWRDGATAHIERLPDDEQEVAWWTRDGNEHVSHLLHLVGTSTFTKRTINMRAAIQRVTLAGGRRRLQLRWSDGALWTRVGACGHGRSHGVGGAGSDRLAPIVLLYLNGTASQATEGACSGSAANGDKNTAASTDVVLKPLAIFAPLVSDQWDVSNAGTSTGQTYEAHFLESARRAFFIAPSPPPGTPESARAWASDEAVGHCRLDQPRALPGGNGAQRWGGGAAAWLIRRRLWRRRLWSWSMARAFASAADATLALAAADAGFVRLTAAPVALALRRALPVRHPVRQLLEPHFVAIGDIDASAAAAAATSRTDPQDDTGKAALAAFKAAQRSAAAVRRRAHAESLAMSWLINATTLGASGALRLAARAHARRFRLARLALPVELASRGFGSPSGECELASTAGNVVPMRFYPYRDDALLLWASMRRYADAALRGATGYPDGDRFVQRDTALRAFIDELRATPPRRHVGLRGVIPPTTVSGLTDMVTTIMFHFTAGHAASRGAHFDAVALAPHRPLALRLPLPPRSAEWGLELEADAESTRDEALRTTQEPSNADFADDIAASAFVRRALSSPRTALMVSGAARIVSAVPLRSLLVDTHKCAQAVFGDSSRCEHGPDGTEKEGNDGSVVRKTAGLRVDFDSLQAYSAFQRALALAQREIERRNRARALRLGCGDMCTYHYLEPRRVAAAIDAFQ